MPPLLERLAEVHLRALAKFAGYEGRYIRDGQPEITITGRAAGVDQQIGGDEQLPMPGHNCDWVFDREELKIDGRPILPQKGDLWRVRMRGAVVTYDVLPEATGEGAYDFMDPTRRLLRVHMKVWTEQE